MRDSTVLSPVPNFFIAGAGRSGTTSLWYYLKEHPEIYVPKSKEPTYFCKLYTLCKDYKDYLRLFSDARGEKALGEKSHAYMTSPESAAWIQKTYPDAKIIFVLRNPADRAWSLYNLMVWYGYEWVFPFEKALAIERERSRGENFKFCNPQYYYNYLYFDSGKYSSQIENYKRVFPENQIHIILFEDLIANTVPVVQAVYDFLGVDRKFVPQVKAHNKSSKIFSASLQCISNRQKLRPYFHKLPIPGYRKIHKKITKLNVFLGRFRSDVFNLDTRKRLQERYEEDIKKTAYLINRDLRHWLK